MVPSGEYFDGEGGTGTTPGCAAFVCLTALVIFTTMLFNKVNERKFQIRQMHRQEIRSADDTVARTLDKTYYMEQQAKRDTISGDRNLTPSDGTHVDLRFEHIKNRLIDALRYRKQRG